MPKLLIIAPSAYTLGGVADWLDYLLPGLSELGWDCVLGLVEGRHHNVGTYLDRHPWQRFVRINNRTGSKEGRTRAIVHAIEKTKPDILAVVNIVDVYEAVRRLRISGKPSPRVVATLHGLQSDLLADLQAESDVIDAVIATNRLSARLAEEALQSVARVLYAPYGVPLFDDVDFNPRQNDGVLRLLYSGRLEQEQKRIFDLPALLRILRDRDINVHLALAGGGPDETTLRKMFEDFGLQKQVGFLGVLKPQELLKEYRRHDALIITSVWETGPIVAWEAMSQGLPVVSSRYVGSGLEAALEDGVNALLFPVGDMQAAAYSVAKLAEAGLHAQLVQSGLNLLKTRYSRHASVEQWGKALIQVLDLAILSLPKSRPAQSPSGRLDRLLGVMWGERIRSVLGVNFKHHGPGGEWPHSGHSNLEQGWFLARAMSLDRIQA